MSRALLSVRRACSSTWGCKSSPNLMEVKGSEAQGRRREAGSEGSAEQRHGLMDKNRIRGVRVGRAGKRPQSPSPSRTQNVNPAAACGQWTNLSRETCRVSRPRD